MGRYALRRAVTSVGLLALSSIVIFVIMRVIPGDPTLTKLGSDQIDIDPKAYAAVRHSLGLDHSLGYQYVHWISGIVHWDFGRSYFSQYPVTSLISSAAGPTLELTLFALALGVL